MFRQKESIVVSLSLMLLPMQPVMADDEWEEELNDELKECIVSADPILSVADFDGNGLVDETDIRFVAKAAEQEYYQAFYDRNVDGEVDKRDVRLSRVDLGAQSTSLDRQIAKLYHYRKQLSPMTEAAELTALDYFQITPSLAGHGEHWTYDGPARTRGFYLPEGVNVPEKHDRTWAVFWSQDASPVFDNGATDYPQPGGAWMDGRVIRFADEAPRFTSSPDETWHTHAGLCITVEPERDTFRIVLNQHTTFNECQALPSLIRTGGSGTNLWVNIWMLHGWLFVPNPHGFFANTHPCLDRHAPPESSINGSRPVPDFFRHQEH